MRWPLIELLVFFLACSCIRAQQSAKQRRRKRQFAPINDERGGERALRGLKSKSKSRYEVPPNVILLPKGFRPPTNYQVPASLPTTPPTTALPNVGDDVTTDEDEEEEDDDQGQRTQEPIVYYIERYSKSGGRKSAKYGGAQVYGKSVKYRSYLDESIEPQPFINCIPAPEEFYRDYYYSKGQKRGKGYDYSRRALKSKSGSKSRGSSSSKSRFRQSERGRDKGGPKDRDDEVYWRYTLPWCPQAEATAPTISSAPSVSSMPSVPSAAAQGLPAATQAPSVPDADAGPMTTASPSVVGATTAPSTAAGPADDGNIVTRIVESRLQYGFFEGVTSRTPTQEEIDGLLVETSRFFGDILPESYPDIFAGFDTNDILVSLGDVAGDYPVAIDFDALVDFGNGATDATAPTPEQIFAVMEAADFQSYIQNYVWSAEPVGTSLFFETQRVSYTARVVR